MSLPQTAYEDYRTLLFPIARRMLGNMEDAEDLVQETILKWLSLSKKKIENPKGYLVRTLINKCLNFIRDHQKESKYEITPELLIDMPPARIDHEHLLSSSFHILFAKLNPIERAVFLLKEVFHYAHREIAELLGIKEEHCRQILARAKRRLKDQKVRFEVITEDHHQLYQKFIDVCNGDDLEELLKLLQADITLYRHEPAASLQSVKGVLPVAQQLLTDFQPYLHLLDVRISQGKIYCIELDLRIHRQELPLPISIA